MMSSSSSVVARPADRPVIRSADQSVIRSAAVEKLINALEPFSLKQIVEAVKSAEAERIADAHEAAEAIRVVEAAEADEAAHEAAEAIRVVEAAEAADAERVVKAAETAAAIRAAESKAITLEELFNGFRVCGPSEQPASSLVNAVVTQRHQRNYDERNSVYNELQGNQTREYKPFTRGSIGYIARALHTFVTCADPLPVGELDGICRHLAKIYNANAEDNTIPEDSYVLQLMDTFVKYANKIFDYYERSSETSIKNLRCALIPFRAFAYGYIGRVRGCNTRAAIAAQRAMFLEKDESPIRWVRLVGNLVFECNKLQAQINEIASIQEDESAFNRTDADLIIKTLNETIQFFKENEMLSTSQENALNAKLAVVVLPENFTRMDVVTFLENAKRFTMVGIEGSEDKHTDILMLIMQVARRFGKEVELSERIKLESVRHLHEQRGVKSGGYSGYISDFIREVRSVLSPRLSLRATE
jgi:hypothetical protein